MNLMTLVRLLVLLAIGWTAVSLGVGVLGVVVPESFDATFFLPRPALADAISLGKLNAKGATESQLLDLTNGRVESLPLPEGEAWSLLSISPWRNKEGKLEAAGRWVSRGADDEAFCGIGFLTLPGSTVKKRVMLDALPTGKPCWLPASPGILFPAGDGQLYRCNITAENRPRAGDLPEKDQEKTEGNEFTATALSWGMEVPGAGVVNITDPAVLPEPAFQRLVFVAIGVQEWRNSQRVNLPTKLWWLVLDDEGDAIVKAGRLLVPDPLSSADDRVFERLPHVVSRVDGKISMVYLERTAPARTWELRVSTLEIDPRTSLPRIETAECPMVLAKDLRPDPLVVSARGDTVYAIDCRGQIVKHPIPH